MRSTLLLLTGGLLVAIASFSCAKGTPFEGTGASSGAGGATVSSTSSSTFLAAATSTSSSSSGSASTSSTSSGACADSPCKLTAPQCGCGANQECSIVNYMPACQPAGTGIQGEACAAAGDCAAGLLCLGGGSTGVCDKFCSTDSDCTSLGGICAISLNNGTPTGTVPNATLCSNSCNPTNGSGCTVPGTGCMVGQEATGQMRWLTFCAGAGTAGANTSCTSSSDCLPEYGCLNTGTSDVCLQFCDVSNPSCTGGATCGALTDSTTMAMIVVDGITLGACQ